MILNTEITRLNNNLKSGDKFEIVTQSRLEIIARITHRTKVFIAKRCIDYLYSFNRI